jgi:hypothetical protein
MTEIVDIGSSRLDPDTNALVVQGKSTPVGPDENDAPDFGGASPVCTGLGIVARPYPKTDEGNAIGIVDDSLPGQNGWIVGMMDRREASAKVVEQLGEGETALHSTGPGFDARVFCKDQMVALIVGDDTAIVIDRKNKQITLSGFGCHAELSEANGVCLVSESGALIQLKGDVACITAPSIVLGGRTPLGPVAYMGPGGPLPAPGVFIGA